MQPKKQFKVQYIGIFEEIDSFYWPKMHFLKEGRKIRAWVDPPPSFGQCPKENVFFSLMSSLTLCAGHRRLSSKTIIIITGQMGILGPKFNFKKRGGDVFKVNLLPDKICCRWQGENGMVKKPWKCASLQRKNGRSKRWVATHNVNWMPDAFFREPRSFFSI